jgi:phage repressor protein C with HTH and peptisase S24 domain
MFTYHNLLEIREMYGLNQGEFATKINYSREAVNKVECGKTKVSKRLSQAIESFLKSTPAPVNSSQYVTYLEKSQTPARNAPPMPYTAQRQQLKNRESSWLVPLVRTKAQAGYVKSYEQVDYVNTLEQYSLPPCVNPAGAVWRYFEIDGDSMEPTLSAADVVLATMVPAEDWQEIKNFCVYIIHTTDQLLIKRIFRKSETEWVLVSDNEELYPQQPLQVEQIKELWLLRRHIRSRFPAPKEFKISA